MTTNGTRARGGAYERKVGRWLVGQSESLGWHLHDHPWLYVGDTVCQPDFLLTSPSGCIILIEVKLTECDCTVQIAKYRRALASHQVTALQIARRITSRPTVDCLENTVDNGLMLLWL